MTKENLSVTSKDYFYGNDIELKGLHLAPKFDHIQGLLKYRTFYELDPSDATIGMIVVLNAHDVHVSTADIAKCVGVSWNIINNLLYNKQMSTYLKRKLTKFAGNLNNIDDIRAMFNAALIVANKNALAALISTFKVNNILAERQPLHKSSMNELGKRVSTYLGGMTRFITDSTDYLMHLQSLGITIYNEGDING